MAVDSTDNEIPFVLTSGAGEVLPITSLEVKSLEHIEVLLDGVATNDYSATLEAVTMEAGTAGQEVLVRRILPLTQKSDYAETDGFPPERIEQDLDFAAQRDQQLQEQLGRSSLVPVGETATNLPPASDRANTTRAFDSSGVEIQETAAQTLSRLELEFPGAAFDRPLAVYETEAIREAATPVFEGQLEVVNETAAAAGPLDAMTLATGTATGERTQTAREQADGLYLPPVAAAEGALGSQFADATDTERIPFARFAGGKLSSIAGLVDAVNVKENDDGTLEFYGSSYLVFKDDQFARRLIHGIKVNIVAEFHAPENVQGLVSTSGTDNTRASFLLGGKYLDTNDSPTDEERTLSYYVRGNENSVSDHGFSWDAALPDTALREIEFNTSNDFADATGDPDATGKSSLLVDRVDQGDGTLISGSVYGLTRTANGKVYFGIISHLGEPVAGTGLVATVHSFSIDTSSDLRPYRPFTPVYEQGSSVTPSGSISSVNVNDQRNLIACIRQSNDNLGDHGDKGVYVRTAQHYRGGLSALFKIADDATYAYQNPTAAWDETTGTWVFLASRWGIAETETTYRESTDSVPFAIVRARVSPTGDLIEAPTVVPNLVKANLPGVFAMTSPHHGIVLKNGAHAGRMVFSFWGYATESVKASDQMFMVYTDDGGGTFSIGAASGAASRVNESAIGELADGTILVSARNSTRGERDFLFSTDGGATVTGQALIRSLPGPVVARGIARVGSKLYHSGPPDAQLNSNARDSMNIDVADISGTGAASTFDFGRGFIVPGFENLEAGYSDLVATPDGTVVGIAEYEGLDQTSSFRYRQQVAIFEVGPSEPPAKNTSFPATTVPVPPGTHQGDLATTLGSDLRLWLQGGSGQTQGGVAVNEVGKPIDRILDGGNAGNPEGSARVNFAGSGTVVPTFSGGTFVYRGRFQAESSIQRPDANFYAQIVVAEFMHRTLTHFGNGNEISGNDGVSTSTLSDKKLLLRGADAAGTIKFATHLPNFLEGKAVVTLRINPTAGEISGRYNGSTSGWVAGNGSDIPSDSYTPSTVISVAGAIPAQNFADLIMIKSATLAGLDASIAAAEAYLATRHGITLA